MMVYCSAMMWGLALPSTVGADGIRIVLVRRFGVRVDDALATILVERGIGFVSALLTAVIGLLILRALVPRLQPTYDYALLLGSVVPARRDRRALLFSFSQRGLDSVLALAAATGSAQSACRQLLTRLHEAYRSLACDRRTARAVLRADAVSEQMLMVACYGVVAVALRSSSTRSSCSPPCRSRS